mgnify:CR=1 FL=1
MIDRDALRTAITESIMSDGVLELTIEQRERSHRGRSHRGVTEYLTGIALAAIWPQIEKLQDDLYNLADKLDEANERADALEERLSECQETCGGLLVRR